MKAEEIRSNSIEEIESLLDDAREEYFKLRFQLSSGQLPDTSRLRIARREIARVATVLRERQQAQPIEGGE
ncbi:MAG: 50S ribosomal protein L29 [Chloroflexi bacterium]|nr:50S ribosomal protein L29 [Chloroflexota bacterium]